MNENSNLFDEVKIDPVDAKNNKAMGILAYISILCFVPIIAAPDSKFARFHANQGLVLFIAEVAFNIVQNILSATVFHIIWPLAFMGNILSIVKVIFLIFAIVGIVNAANGQAKELPIIGSIHLLQK